MDDRVSLRVAAAPRDRRDQEEHDGEHDRARAARGATAGRAPPPAPRQRDPEHEQDVRDELPVSDPRTTSGRPSATANSAMISSGALPKLAFRKPPIPGPVCSPACSVDSPISHASGTSASAESTKSGVVAGMGDVVDEDRGGREGERRPEELPRHGAYPSRACSRQSSSTGATR